MEAGADEMEASAADATDRPTASKTTKRSHFHYMVLGTSRPSQHPRSDRHGTSSARHGEARVFTKLHAAHLCVCSNGEPCAAGGPDRAAADSASVPAPPGVSPNPAWPCALASQKPQPHSSRHAKYNPVDSAGRSSDSQCGQARRRAMRGRAHCSTHHTRGRALFEW